MTEETKAFIDKALIEVSFKPYKTAYHLIKIIEAQDKEIERLKLKVEVAAEEEREACAKIAHSTEWAPSAWKLNEVIAEAIRARGES